MSAWLMEGCEVQANGTEFKAARSDSGRISLCPLGSNLGRTQWTVGQGDDSDDTRPPIHPQLTMGLWLADSTIISVALGTKWPHV